MCPTAIKTQWNNYLSCNGLISWAELPAWFPPSYLSGSLTVEGWLYVHEAAAPASLMSLRTEAPAGQAGALVYRLGKASGARFYFELGNGQGKSWRVEAEAPVAAGEWIHVAGVFQEEDRGPDRLSLYVNGRRVGSTEEEIDLRGLGLVFAEGPAERLRLAGEPGEPLLSGRLDEVRISSTARYTEALIFSITNTFSMDAATVALWHFDEPLGSSLVADASGNGHDLVLIHNQTPWSATLEDFTVQNYGVASVLLSWKTSKERDLFGFEVQRRSVLKDFACIGLLPAHGAGAQPFRYEFTDMPEKSGRYYYRLRMLGTAGPVLGDFRFSPEEAVYFAGAPPGAQRAKSPEPVRAPAQ